MERLLSGAVPPFESPFGQVTSMGHTLYFPLPYRRPLRGHAGQHHVDGSVLRGSRRSRLLPDRNPHLWGAGRQRTSAPLLGRAGARARHHRAGGTELRERRPPAAPSPSGAPAAVTKPDRRARAPLRPPSSLPREAARSPSLRLFTDERDPDKLRTTYPGRDLRRTRRPSASRWSTSSAPGRDGTRIASLPLSVEADGTLLSRFPMPFHRQARIAITYQGPGSVDIGGTLAVERRRFDERSLAVSRPPPPAPGRARRGPSGTGTSPPWRAARPPGGNGPRRRESPRGRRGGAKATRRSSSTAKPFPASSAPAPRTTLATPGHRRRRSPTPITPRRAPPVPASAASSP